MAPTSERQTSPSSADEKYRAQYFRPLLAGQIVDPRLDTVKPSMWTNVSADDNLMRAILRAYLLSECNRFLFFHKDHFLDDMVQGSNRLCSPLLVNAVLAVACVSVPLVLFRPVSPLLYANLPQHYYRALPNRSEFWNPRSLAYKFSAEAKRLWGLEQQANKSSLTSLQATGLIGRRFVLCGMERIGRTYLLRSIAMAHELKLFEQSTTNIKDNRMRHSRDFTAWCLFNLQRQVKAAVLKVKQLLTYCLAAIATPAAWRH
jgi:hypothetical protein